jgi:uncharacterized protein YjbI with pentapeptide repeats
MRTTGIETDAAIPQKQTREHISRLELKGILQAHQEWTNSGGKEGQKAALAYANLVSSDLAGANLQGTDLQKANLNWAILVLANLKDAFLFQASLQDADLLGAELQGANLQGASLGTATGLSVQQLAGTNLSGALLPKHVADLLGRDQIARSSKNAGRLLAAIVSLGLLAAGLIAATRDVQLVTNFSAFSIPYIGQFIPVVQFYLVAPLLLLGLQIYFHFYLQRLWEGLAGLPAIFPDGRPVDQGGSRIVVALGRFHLQRENGHLPRPLLIEAVIAVALAYWLVPATLFFMWARYLTRQDMRGTMLQVFATVAATGIAVFLPQIVDKTFHEHRGEPSPAEFSRVQRYLEWAKTHWRGVVPVGSGLILLLLSWGTIHGLPHDTSWVPEAKTGGATAWGANVFWMAGYDPYPVLTEAAVSTKPANWSGREEDLGQVSGAWLNQSRLRYVQAYRAFLAKGRLWESDMRGAFLSEADLRQANLRQVNLDSAVLDRALMDHANLQGANLQKANLTRADLRGANLSFANFSGATLVDTQLEEANLYAATLPGATLQLANLRRADLRNAEFKGACLIHADMAWADLWYARLSEAKMEGATLENAILIEADLRKADLHTANLQRSILRGTDLTGANLEGADLRGAMGLSAGQICSAANRRNVQLDGELEHEVELLCGEAR